MIIPLLLANLLLATPVKDTVWWNTQGGRVMEHRDQSVASCSLLVYDADGSVTFDRDASGETTVTASASRWLFRAGTKTPVALQLGEEWLSNHGGSLVIEATADGHTVAFAANHVIDDLLPSADHILLKTTTSDLTISLVHSRLRVLVERMRKCSSAIRPQ